MMYDSGKTLLANTYWRHAPAALARSAARPPSLIALIAGLILPPLRAGLLAIAREYFAHLDAAPRRRPRREYRGRAAQAAAADRRAEAEARLTDKQWYRDYLESEREKTLLSAAGRSGSVQTAA